MSEYDYWEGYYGSMIGELSDIDNLLENRSLDEIDRYIQGLRVETYDYKHTLNLPLYRARYAEGFDINNPEQFSYNHNTDCIKRHRYNKEKEAVLYTATNPLVAFKEIKEDGKPDSFYLAVWKPRNKAHVFNLALNLNGSVVPMNSNAGRFNRILKKNTGAGSSQNQYLSMLGSILERSGADYRFSSLLASRILKGHDALMTTSLQSDGKELNVTFNKQATDDLLRLQHVYHCNVPQKDTLAFDVTEIGIREGNTIEWFAWSVDLGSIVYNDSLSSSFKKELHQAILTDKGIEQRVMRPNVIRDPRDWHDGIVVYKGSSYHIKFKILLEPKKVSLSGGTL